MCWAAFAGVAAFAFPAVGACGKKGPPLPPLVKLPVAPVDLVAERRGNNVDLQFTVPSANTDGTRPANVAHAEIYAITAPQSVAPLTDAQVLKLGTSVGSVAVKTPKDPNLTADVDDPSDEVDAPQGPGLEQGAVARLEEPLSTAMMTPVAVPADKNAPASSADTTLRPLVGAPPAVLSRTYAAFGTSARGRKGPLSKRIVVPLVAPPPAPAAPTIAYDETTVTVSWPVVALPASMQAPASGDLLPSRVIGVATPTLAYNVYDVTHADAAVKLTKTPIEAPRYADPRIVWGEQRCYTVRTAETIGGMTIESDAPPARCETLVDTFAPAAPKGVATIPSDGAINLIWEPNSEKDLAGYLVLRAGAAGEEPKAITPAPIQETSFKDTVAGGVQFTYVVKAIDKAGNASAPSARVSETAR